LIILLTDYGRQGRAFIYVKYDKEDQQGKASFNEVTSGSIWKDTRTFAFSGYGDIF
jgi:hypothetical protein